MESFASKWFDGGLDVSRNGTRSIRGNVEVREERGK